MQDQRLNGQYDLSSIRSRKNGKHRVLSVLCRVFGIVLIIGVIGLCMPVTLPRIMGYEVYDVVSGSMEPEIPTGSVLYVKPVDQRIIAEGDVIAYQDAEKGTVVAHRVVYNRDTLGEFVTKGDANNTEDRAPIPYAAVIGRVEMHLPFFGAIMALYSSTVGKVYLLLVAGIGLMLCILGERLSD